MGEKRLKVAGEYLESYNRPDPYMLEAQLAAFASVRVHEASWKSFKAAQAAWGYYRALVNTSPDWAANIAELDELEKLLQAASDADGVVIDVIRTELQGNGPALVNIDMFSLDKQT
jgi:hypothetical protein